MMSQFVNNIYLRIASLRILGIKKNSTKSGKTEKNRKIDVMSQYDGKIIISDLKNPYTLISIKTQDFFEFLTAILDPSFTILYL